jgi:hypothetical protein
VTYKAVDGEGGVLNRWVLRYGKSQGSNSYTLDQHSHSFAENPLIYPKHRKAEISFQGAIPQALSLRTSNVSFRQAERILHGQSLKIDRNTYYNLARSAPMAPTTEGLLALVSVLERDGWIYRTLWEFVKNDLQVVINQVLKAVFFTNDELIKLARRFCPDWMIQTDGTFNTNRIKMPLIDCLGVNNTGKSFIFAFAFVTSESSDNWGFVLECLEQTVFNGL